MDMETLERLSFSVRISLAPCLFLFQIVTRNTCSWTSRFYSETLSQRIPSTYLHLKDGTAGLPLNLRPHSLLRGHEPHTAEGD